MHFGSESNVSNSWYTSSGGGNGNNQRYKNSMSLNDGMLM